jgi:hypothetical protein
VLTAQRCSSGRWASGLALVAVQIRSNCVRAAAAVASQRRSSNVLKSGCSWRTLVMLGTTERPHPFLPKRSREVFLLRTQRTLNRYPVSYSSPSECDERLARRRLEHTLRATQRS